MTADEFVQAPGTEPEEEPAVERDAFRDIGWFVSVGSVLFVFLCAAAFAVTAFRIVNDPTPAFTIQPEPSTVTTVPDGTTIRTKKVQP